MKKLLLILLMLATEIFSASAGDEPAASGISPISSSVIQLDYTRLDKLLEDYAALVGRTVLCKDVPNISLVLKAATTNKAEAASLFTNALRQQGFTVVLDGDKFVKVMKTSELETDIARSSWLKAPSKDSAATKEKYSGTIIPQGEIDLPAVSLDQVLPIYAELVGVQMTEHNDEYRRLPPIKISFKSQTALSQAEVKYAFDILFSWHGFKLVVAENKMLRVVWLPAP